MGRMGGEAWRCRQIEHQHTRFIILLKSQSLELQYVTW